MSRESEREGGRWTKLLAKAMDESHKQKADGKFEMNSILMASE